MSGRELRQSLIPSQQFTMETKSPPNPAPTRNQTGNWDGSTIRSATGRTLINISHPDDNWKPVKDRTRLQRVGSTLTDGATVGSGVPEPLTIDVEVSRMPCIAASSLERNSPMARTISRHVSVRPMVNSPGSGPPMQEIVITEITDVTDEIEDEPIRTEEKDTSKGISLMDLLEQTDNTWGNEGPDAASAMAKDDEYEEGEDDEYTEEAQEMTLVCCICMVKHKGAAFNSCGHTFCRLCSRELWVRRDYCPLCNAFVQEILDIL